MSIRNNDFFKAKKEWSKTKDDILGKYLLPYFQKIFALKKPVCYVDCFAGKGVFEDGSIGSPLIAIEKISMAIAQSFFSPSVYSYFIELNYADELKTNIERQNIKNFKCHIVDGKFEDNIDSILVNHQSDTVFLYIDPYGIKALNVEKFNNFKTSKNKSVELLINFNTWGFFREACRVLKADFKLNEEINEYLIEYEPSNNISRDELIAIAGGDYWIQIVKEYKNGHIDARDAEEKISEGIANSFKKAYRYVLNVPIKSNLDNAVTKYRLFHLTNHNKGCLIMADNMFKRFNEACERERDGQISLFDFSFSGELGNRNVIKQNLLSIIRVSEKRLTEVLCDFYCNYGISAGQSILKELLKELEDDKKIVIRRDPAFTKTGKKSFAMDESSDRKIYVKKALSIKSITKKSLLYKTEVEYGDYTINHVLGCSHGCMFPCYAFNMAKRFGNVKTYQEWIEPKLVSNAIELLDNEIPKYKEDIKSVQLSFTTDPFMVGYPEVSELSIEIINRLNKDGIKAITLSKGVIPVEALNTEHYNEFGITLVSLDEKFRKKYEPGTAPYIERIEGLKRAHDAGFKTWVSIEPYPTPNIIEQNLEDILKSISFVDYIVFGRWHYNRIITEYKNRNAFYNECAKLVIDFCKAHNIRYHIKEGTITHEI